MWLTNHHLLVLASLTALGLSTSPRDVGEPMSGDISSFDDVTTSSTSLLRLSTRRQSSSPTAIEVSQTSMAFELVVTITPSSTTVIVGPGLGPGGNAPVSLTTSSQGASTAATTAASSTAAASAGTTAVTPENKCWSTEDCEVAFGHFNDCYVQTGDIVQPNEHSNRSEVYQQCLCTADYKT